MSKKRDRICPHLESTHSMAVLYYVCQAAGKKGLKIKTKDVNSYPCFTTGHEECKNYKKRKK